ncbi:MAG: DNA polymerase III subunit beta, partial [Luteibaculum sp.]
PILDNFFFDIKKDAITISASDLETTISTTVEAKSESEGKVCMPAKMLVDALKSFPDQPLSFTINKEDYGVEISSDLGKYKLNGFNGEEFPKTPQVEDASSVKIGSDLLARAINKTLFATGNDDLRPIMSGIYFDFKEDGLTFVATDAHKLVRYGRSDAKAAGISNFVVPKKPLNLLKSLLATTADDVEITYNENNAHFNLGNSTVVCRLIDGNYPNYEAVIPKDNPNRLNISRTALLNSIKRVSIFANKTTHQVRLKISGNELSISAEDLDFSNEAQEKLSCQYTGEDMEIGFNSRFLSEMLNNLEGDDVVMELSAPSRAGILLPEAKDIEEEDILMLVMPVMLNSN